MSIHPEPSEHWFHPAQAPDTYLLFQREFHRAFRHLPQHLLREIWIVDDGAETTTLRTRPEDTIIIPWRSAGSVLGFMALQEDRPAQFSQYRHFGFDRPPQLPPAVEVLTLFRTSAPAASTGSLKRAFVDGICRRVVTGLGYRYALATCTPAMLPFYRRWGMQVLGGKTTGAGTRFLIGLDLQDAPTPLTA